MNLHDAQTQIDELRAGLESRGRIGMAIGLVMGRFRVDEHAAFGYLLRQSQHENIKLKLVAEAVISEHASPAPTARAVPAAVL